MGGSMIGFYNYSVILTCVGLVSALLGITRVFAGDFKSAVLCMIVSGICDMFDGNIARLFKNRSEQEKSFGIQIDSLCDLVCFGVFPAIFGYFVSTNKIIGEVSAILLVLAAVIRLAYFNVKEIKRQQETTEKRKYYQGLPVTSMSMILPTCYCFRNVLGAVAYPYVLPGVYLITSFLFLYDFKFYKPSRRTEVIMAIYGVALLLGTLLT